MSRRWFRIAAACLGLGLVMGFFGCDCLRPPGKWKIEPSEDDFVSVDDGWFVFGGQPRCHTEDCAAWGKARDEDNAVPWRLVYLSGYRIMTREVTNAEYLECVQERACEAPADCIDAELWGEVAAGFAAVACPYSRDEVAFEPVRDVSWIEARKYCRWRYAQIDLQADLPTEAQWERAAVGPAEDGVPFVQPTLPLAADVNTDNLSCDRLVHGVGQSCVEDGAMPDNPVYDNEPHPFAIFDYPDDRSAALELRRAAYKSPAGLLDMAGNVAEWTLDASDEEGTLWCGFPPELVSPSGIQRAVPYLGERYAVVDSSECYPSNVELSCAREAYGLPSEVAFPDYICNPVQGEDWEELFDHNVSLEGANVNAYRVVKGGHYVTKSWCDLSPRARDFALEEDRHIGFRCAVWDDPVEKWDTVCDPTSLPPMPQADRPDAGTPDAAAADAGADDAASQDT